MVCAAVEAMIDCCGGEVGVPVDDVLDTDRSLAEVDGTGSHLWAGVGLEGSRGGARMMFFGIDATGCECKTSLWRWFSYALRAHCLITYPACIWIEESPPHPVFPHFPHLLAAVEEHRQHPFAKVDDANVFFRLGRLGSIVCH